MSRIRDNLRITLLVVAVLASLFLLFGPGVGGGTEGGNATAANATATDGPTNLRYGLELSGGTRVQAPLIGWTATGIEYDGANRTAVQADVAGNLEGVGARDVAAVPPSGTSGDTWAVEVRSANVSQSDVRSAVEAAGFSPERVRQGVTSDTRGEVVEVLQNKIDETGIQGGQVRSIYSVSEDRYFVVAEVPNANSSEVRQLLSGTGQVEVQAYHQAENGTFVNRTVATNDDFTSIGVPQRSQAGNPYVSVSVQQGETAQQFQRDMVETGIASSGGSRCGWPGENGPCILIVREGNVVGSFGMQPRLASSMMEGTWASDPGFRLPTNNYSEAQQLSVNLRAGALPTGLAIDQGSISYISPSFGADARINSIIAAIAAVLAVSGVVVARYGDVRVAVPMVATALSEVVLLLGFAAGVGLALDLSHIAGFIAVIGTGVDDLVIIADDILQQGDVQTDRVFQSRFRKALWVIGAAAATTIIAMSPLAILSLQQLRGFAIVTIVGVLLGVLVTRPAYGDILRSLVMGEER
ncbi:preprotein translocase subunit SecD [Halomicrobium salinisoli]|uniref:preprotein translocase subunit SecD n=1 Tax=Halomicrobium salinisoli TaxID=2878391 RepID=UPI001CF0C8DA|nr:preprotein translocase subunit SecD [Halomicrobium salinisoli]